MNVMISKSAMIREGSIIGKNVYIGNFTTIEEDVLIGDNCWIGNNVNILNGTRIGNNCEIHAGAVLGGNPQDLKYQGEYTTLEIGDNNCIRESVTINRGTHSKGKTVLGNGNMVMANAHIGHDCQIGNHCIIGFSVGMAGEVVVDDWANISGLTGIHQFSRIGKHCMISGLSRVVKDVPPFIIAAREPLAYAGVNRVGLKRRGFSTQKIEAIQDIYRFLFDEKRNVSQAVEQIEQELPTSEERNEVLNFIQYATRGIIKGYQGIY